jgi:hypothetical protein
MLQTFNRKIAQITAALLLAAAAANSAFADDKQTFVVKHPADELTRITAKLEVRGDLKMKSAGKESTAPLTVVGKLRYDERVLAWGDSVTDESRSVRHYDEAEAHISIDGKSLPVRKLADEKRLIGQKIASVKATPFAPQDLLTRDDVELLTITGDSLAVDRLVPSDALAVGDTWKLPAKAVILLCNLDEADSVDVEGKLAHCTADEAKFEFQGKVEGAIDGISTELELNGKFFFDRRKSRVVWLALSVKEKREMGFVAPGVEATSRLQLQIEPLSESVDLATDRLATLPLEGNAGQLLLLHKPASGRFTVAHDRRWQVINDNEKVAVFRMMDRGELVAQANVSPAKKLPEGKSIALEAFQDDVRTILGKGFGSFVKASEGISQHGYRVLRVEAIGRVDDLEITWTYYHLTDRQGNALALSFTRESRLAEQFAEGDVAFIEGLQLVDAAASAAPAAESASRSILAPAR